MDRIEFKCEGAPMFATVEKWQKHGKNRLYIKNHKGQTKGYYDLQSGKMVWDNPTPSEWKQNLEKALAEYLKNIEKPASVQEPPVEGRAVIEIIDDSDNFLLTISIKNAYPIKDQLKQTGFKWDKFSYEWRKVIALREFTKDEEWAFLDGEGIPDDVLAAAQEHIEKLGLSNIITTIEEEV